MTSKIKILVKTVNSLSWSVEVVQIQPVVAAFDNHMINNSCNNDVPINLT